MSTEINKTDIKALEDFNRLLNKPVPAKHQNIHQGATYVPVGYMETTLDSLYFGLWQTKNITVDVKTNEIVATLELGVFHPVLKQWIWRAGTGSVPIQQRSGSQISSMVDTKIKNAIQKNAPAAKAFAFKNAAQSLGTVFGRDLNRSFTGDYVPGSTTMAIQEAEDISVEEAIAAAPDALVLKSIFDEYKSVSGIPQLINARRKELKSQKALNGAEKMVA